MKQGDYHKHTVEDFIADPAFRSWVAEGGDERAPFWRALIRTAPEQREKAMEAKKILAELHQTYHPVEVRAAERAGAGFEELKNRIERREKRQDAVKRRKWMAWTAAAAVILLLGSGVLLWRQPFGVFQQEYVTQFGEQREVRLPDGSLVLLNADSKLRLGKNWTGNQRELWLEGEAYFEVEEKPAAQTKFVVHTPGLDVQVLGTSFNVRTRRQTTQVALDEGSIQLIRTGEGVTETQTMTPGELASFDRDSEQLTIRKKETLETYTSWKEGILIFDDITLLEACRRMEEVHGLEIQIRGEEQKQLVIHKLSVPMDNADVFVETLQALFFDQLEIDYDVAGKTVRIE